jgi:hypothetical protein
MKQKSVDAITESAGSFLEQHVEPVAIFLGEEHGLAAIAAKVNAWFSCHG